MASTATKISKTAPKAAALKELDAELEETAAPAKTRRSLPKILLLLTLPLAAAGGGGRDYPGHPGAGTAPPAGGGGGGYYLGNQEPATPPKAGSAKAAAAKPVSTKPPVFVALEPFTVNLQREDSSPQYLQVGLSLKLADEMPVEKIKLHMPEIRNRVLLLLSSKRASEIATSEGKKSLSEELQREVSQPLAGGVPAKALDSVLFTSFVIQ